MDPFDIESSELSVLDWVPSYEALSYCWGDAPAQNSITTNDEDVRVTANLFAVLQHLRNETEARILWIAVCIDQNNKEL